MYRVLQADIVIVPSNARKSMSRDETVQTNKSIHVAPLFEESLRIGHIFPNRACLPRPERARGVNLIECRSAVQVEPRNKQ